jgi:hypothetical protein
MNLQPLSGPPFGFNCVRCAARRRHVVGPVVYRDDDPHARADLDGEPFKTYVCGDCVVPYTVEQAFHAAKARKAQDEGRA